MKKIGLVLGPLLFFLVLLMPISADAGFTRSARSGAAVMAWTVVWWITEAIPIAVTSLLPVILFTLLGVLSMQSAASAFMNSSLFLFMGGMFIAMGMQKWGLHKRMALHMIRLVGTSPCRLVLGFLLATGFVSLWINNTAAAVMLFPIGMALIDHFRKQNDPDLPLGDFAFALMLAIAYGANIGGIGTKIGTAPNMIFAGHAEKAGTPVTFDSWLMVGFPVVLILIPLAWLCLVGISTRLYRVRSGAGKAIVASELRAMGRMNRGEKTVLIVFLITVACWLFRDGLEFQFQRFLTGCGLIPAPSDKLKLFGEEIIALLAALALFVLPVDSRKGEHALDWEWAGKIPWDVLLLLGGGFVLSEGFEKSGLSEWLANRFSILKGVSPFILVLGGTALTLGLSAVASNTATVNIMLPILSKAAQAVKIHPVMLMMPATIASSCDFMLPAGTPPNAIVFGSGYLTIPRMAKTGLLMDFLSIIVVAVLCYFLIPLVYGIPLP